MDSGLFAVELAMRGGARMLVKLVERYAATRRLSEHLCKPLAVGLVVVLVMVTSSLVGQQLGDNGDQAAREVANLKDAIGALRDLPSIRVEVEWKMWVLTSAFKRKSVLNQERSPSAPPQSLPERLEMEARETFIAKGQRYRISQEYDKKSPGLTIDAAFDEEHFQFLQRAGSVLWYSKKQQRNFMMALCPIPQLQPLQFLSVKPMGKYNAEIAWPDIFDDKLIHDRLAKGVAGMTKTKSGDRPTVTFPGGKFDGQPVSFRLFVDGPNGQPAETDYVDEKGRVIFEAKFEYSQPIPTKNRWVPVRVVTNCFDAHGKIVASTSAVTTKLEIDPKLAEDAFTIDLLSANTVIDIDAKKAIKGTSFGMNELKAAAPEKPAAKQSPRRSSRRIRAKTRLHQQRRENRMPPQSQEPQLGKNYSLRIGSGNRNATHAGICGGFGESRASPS